MKPGTPVLRSTRLLDQLRERIRYLHYSLSTEKAYLHWVRFFVRWHGRNGEMRHPRDMGAAEVEAFLNMLANERRVSTHNQAFSAILFLYREVLGIDLPWLDGVNRPAQSLHSQCADQGGGEHLVPISGWGHALACPIALWHRHATDGGVALAHQGC